MDFPINHDPGPSAVLGKLAKVCSHQCISPASCSIHDRHSILSLRLKELSHQDVVLKYLESRDRGLRRIVGLGILTGGPSDRRLQQKAAFESRAFAVVGVPYPLLQVNYLKQ